MALAPRLDLRQSQSLVMTPQLQQAIKLLQLSNLELADYVQAEIEKNPLIEERGDAPREEARGEDTPKENGTSVEGDVTGFEEGTDGMVRADAALSDTPNSQATDNALDADFGNEVYHHDSPNDAANGTSNSSFTESGLSLTGASSTGTSGPRSSDDSRFEENLAGEISLRDHLLEQLPALLLDPMEHIIGAHLVDMVNEAGYLTGDLPDLCDRLGCDDAAIEIVLTKLQTMDPVGVLARNLAECLSIQLREKDRLDPAMAALIENLDLLAARELSRLKRICGVDDEDIAEMIQEIRDLNPKPGHAFGSEPVQPVVPDVFIRKNPAGAWLVELNSETLPKVLVNNRYHAELSEKARGDDKIYLSECLSNASWLVKALDQRAKTILKVATELVRQQEGFFNHGVAHLKPLNLRAIADEIDMHESTVSRVTNNKYISTSRGVFEMKYFFTSAIQSSHGGEALSAEAVRHRLRDLVDNEDPKKILSDDKLVALLKTEGIDIARRTVAKYRDALRIPSSVERRRQKNLPR